MRLYLMAQSEHCTVVASGPHATRAALERAAALIDTGTLILTEPAALTVLDSDSGTLTHYPAQETKP